MLFSVRPRHHQNLVLMNRRLPRRSRQVHTISSVKPFMWFCQESPVGGIVLQFVDPTTAADEAQVLG